MATSRFDDPTLDASALLAAVRSETLPEADVAAALANPNLPLDEVALDLTSNRGDAVPITASDAIHRPRMYQALLANPSLPFFLLTDAPLAKRMLLVLLGLEIADAFAEARHELTLSPTLYQRAAFLAELRNLLRRHKAIGTRMNPGAHYQFLLGTFRPRQGDPFTLETVASDFFGYQAEGLVDPLTEEEVTKVMLESAKMLPLFLEAPEDFTLGPFVAADLLGAYP